MQVYSPTGSLIIGTKEIIHATAMISDFFPVKGGGFKFQYSGESNIDWSDQETVIRKGERIFIDENGDEWPESQLVVR